MKWVLWTICKRFFINGVWICKRLFWRHRLNNNKTRLIIFFKNQFDFSLIFKNGKKILILNLEIL